MSSMRRMVFAVAGMACAAFTPLSAAEPLRPTSDATILAIVPASQDQAAASLRSDQIALASDRDNLALALRTARMAIEAGRSAADPRRYGQAQAALAPWWSAPEPPEEVRVLRAVVAQAYHDFDGALADLDAILARSPDNAQARLSRAFVRMVTGDVEAGGADCRALPAGLDPVIAIVCKARADALSGKASEARDSLLGALTPGTAGTAMRGFGLAVLADTGLALGRADEASRIFAEATAGGNPDVSILAAYADLLLDGGRPAEALSLLDGKGNADILILRRAIAAKKLNDPRLAGWASIMNERFAAAAAGGVRVHLREEARFRLEVEGDTVKSLELAIDNWSVQKEPADARLLLESAVAANQPAAAQPVIDFVRRTGLTDARLQPLLAKLESP